MDLPVTLSTPLRPEEARAKIIRCLASGMLSGGNPRPLNMRGWGWSRIEDTNNRMLFQVTRAPGTGSVKGLQLQCTIQASSSGSTVTVDWGPGGRSGFMIGLGSVIEKEVRLLRGQLAS